MKATVMHGAGDVRVEQVPDPKIIEPTDAILRVTQACICGSDLWPYASMEPSETGQSMGHEAIGVVEDIGAEVRNLKRGDLVVMPFAISDGTLFPLSVWEDDALMPSLLTLSDVMGTGHHAAVVARVAPGKIAAVVGDGAVGLCGVIAAKRLGAEQIIILGRHEDRIALAREFGATDIVPERGEEAVERVRELTGGHGAHSVLECVGLEQSELTAIEIARPGGAVGRVGVPQEEKLPASQPAFYNNVTVGGGPAPVRAYVDELLPDILEGRIDPGRVFDRTVDLDGVPDGYRAMADRESIKVMIKP
jgi:threonine dehydrogenase-like Zn-dependent dehydrogenase